MFIKVTTVFQYANLSIIDMTAKYLTPYQNKPNQTLLDLYFECNLIILFNTILTCIAIQNIQEHFTRREYLFDRHKNEKL